jgi:hypothetical protein
MSWKINRHIDWLFIWFLIVFTLVFTKCIINLYFINIHYIQLKIKISALIKKSK